MESNKSSNRILKKFLFQKISKNNYFKDKNLLKSKLFNSLETIKFKKKINFFNKEILNDFHKNINKNNFKNGDIDLVYNKIKYDSCIEEFTIINNKVKNNKFNRVLIYLNKHKIKGKIFDISIWGIYEGKNKETLNILQQKFHKNIINNLDFENIFTDKLITINIKSLCLEFLKKYNILDTKINLIWIINNIIIHIFNRTNKITIFDNNNFSTTIKNKYHSKEFLNIKIVKMNNNDKYIVLRDSFAENFIKEKNLIEFISNFNISKNDVKKYFKSFINYFNFSFILINFKFIY